MPFIRVVLTLLLLSACRGGVAVAPSVPLFEPLPEPPREFRAAWVATVNNIDWPSKPGLSTDEQQDEAVAILDRLAELNFNAVILQVRPHCDAFYASTYEPWSAYLTGQEGTAPEPFYDPLAFWIEEAHARGLQLHAWFNPYRAAHPGRPGAPAADSILNRRPELVVTLGTRGYRWLDPALDEVREWSTRVVLDVVRRYDVDGVHFDDYFYPYASYNEGADFPDESSYAAYRAAGGTLGRADFRRAAVDGFVEGLAGAIKSEKPWVEFGISPFGIWRPGHPEGIRGLDQYDALYSDARRWLVEGWVDYLMPQLYWPIAQLEQSFPVLLGWWQRQNPLGRHVWPGTSIARMRGEGGADELVGQILVVRGMEPERPGICLFSVKHLMAEDSSLADSLARGPFARRALIPSSPWLSGEPPGIPLLRIDGEGVEILPSSADRPLLWLVHERRSGAWSWTLLPGSESRHRWSGARPEALAVQAVDRRRVLGAANRVEFGEGKR